MDLFTDAISGVSGAVAGAIAGVSAMFYQKVKTDARINRNDDAIRIIERNYVPRSEILAMHKEAREETKSMHKDLNNKLDTVIDKLAQINVTLERKADRK